MKHLLLSLSVCLAACGRAMPTGPVVNATTHYCPETAANQLADTTLVGRNLPSVSVYVCHGIVPKP